MKRDVTVISLRQFESAGGLSDGYAFEDFSCPLNVARRGQSPNSCI